MNRKPLSIQAHDRVLLIAPHPDDETIVAGGLLQHAVSAGAAVRIVFVTDGDNNPWPQRLIERRWKVSMEDRMRWGVRRRQEVLNALSCLGVKKEKAIFLKYPDQGITDLFLSRDEQLAGYLANEIEKWKPTILVTPSPLDLHPDHNAVAVIVQQALFQSKRNDDDLLWLEFIVHSHSQKPKTPSVYVLPLSLEQQQRKRDAIFCHKTQILLRNRKFLSYVREEEEFSAASENYAAAKLYHPVYDASVSADLLHLKLRMPWRWDVYGQATLFLATNKGGFPRDRFTLALPSHAAGRVIEIYDFQTERVVASAHVHGTQRHFHIHIPMHVFEPMDQLLVKLEHRFGFFDRAGWRELQVEIPEQTEPFSSCEMETAADLVNV